MKKTFAEKHPDKAEQIIQASLQSMTVRQISVIAQVPKSTVGRFTQRLAMLPSDPDIRRAEILGLEYLIRVPAACKSYLEEESILRGWTPRHLVEKVVCIVVGERMIKAVLDDT